MKKSIVLLISVLFAINAFAQFNNIISGECGPNLTWTLDLRDKSADYGTFTISGTGAMWDYANFNSNYWTVLYWQNITQVVIGNEVTSIGNYAFSGCSYLTSIIIPESVTSIGSGAFWNCNGLTSVTIPNSVTNIGSNAFEGCSRLTSITIPEHVTWIGYAAFHNCSNLSTVNFNAINCECHIWGTFCYDETFSRSTKITTLNIGNQVQTIPGSIFSQCIGLTSVTIPGSVKSIGHAAFGGCSGLISITIPESMTSIGESAFSGCSSLISITIPRGVTNIGKRAFGNCTNLTTVNFNATNCTYDNKNYPGAFSGCTSFTTLNIGNNVQTIPDLAFLECKGLTSVTISNGVKNIGEGAFGGCSRLSSIIIPESVTSIGRSAFFECSSLTSITIPNHITKIESGTFSDCNNLTSISIPDSVRSIGVRAFYKCSSLSSIIIPDSIMSIQGSAFNGCTKLRSVDVQWNIPLRTTKNWESEEDGIYSDSFYSHNDIFYGVDLSQDTLYVPVGTKELYETAPVWKDFGYIIEKVELYSLDGKRMRGIAADGTAQLKIRIGRPSGENVPELLRITFYKGSNPLNKTTDGEIIQTSLKPQPVSGKSYYEFLYIAPKEHDLGDFQSVRTLDITAVLDFETESKRLDFQIKIIRPPVMMVHGLNADYKTFESLQNVLCSRGYNSFQLWNMDYSDTNTQSFEDNYYIFLWDLQKLLYDVKNNGFAAQKADIVGHSMGGLLARQYLQSDKYSNNIHKLITLNTPHSGSQGANFIMDMTDHNGNIYEMVYYLATKIGSWTGMNADESKHEVDRFIKYGAVKDLCVNSNAINDLNVKQLNKNIVPSHAIYTTTSNFPANKDLFLALIEVMIRIGRNSSVSSLLFNGEANDLVVAVSSQKGGLAKVTYIPDVWHSSTTNSDVINTVVSLLNESVDNENVFSIGGYHPPKLSWNGVQKTKSATIRSADDCEVCIISIDKSQCANGDEINVLVEGSENITKMSFLVQGERPSLLYMETKEGNSNEFTYTIPESALGEKKILVIGYTDNGNIATATSQVAVTTEATLIYIEPEKEKLSLVLNSKEAVRVQGLFSDGIFRDITNLAGLKFEMKGVNAVLEEPNIVVGKQAGSDELLISINKLQTILPIKIFSVEEIDPSEIKKAIVDNNFLNVICYPNPANDYFIISGAEGSNMLIVDITGRSIYTQKNITKEETVNTSAWTKGTYFVIIQSGNNKIAKKIIKY